MKLPYLILLAVLAFTVACGASATSTADDASQPLVFLPDDEAPHDVAIEWWYFNGLVTDDQGKEYSYHYVTFQSEGVGTAVPHLLQASLGDHSAKAHLTGEKVLLGAFDHDANGIDVSVSGWAMKGDGETYDLKFDLTDYLLDLQAVSVRPPVLHQGVGLVSLGPAGDTFYYSRTRLDVTGSITVAGQQSPVTGSAWMDHQWGEIVDQRVGWDWVSVQLDDGADLMAVLIWDPSSRTPIASYGTLVLPNGSATILQQGDVSITPKSTWTSPDSGIEYPSGWVLAVPSLDLRLELEAVLLDAEFADSRYAPAAYWEGEVRVTGTRQGQSVGGRGFVELVGYDPRQLEPPPTP